jgi:hypothetical protein
MRLTAVVPTLSQRMPVGTGGPFRSASRGSPIEMPGTEPMQSDSTDEAIIRSRETGKFWGFGRWMPEYPDAQRFSTNEAIQKATGLRTGQPVEVIRGYGDAHEEVVFKTGPALDHWRQRHSSKPELER